MYPTFHVFSFILALNYGSLVVLAYPGWLLGEERKRDEDWNLLSLIWLLLTNQQQSEYNSQNSIETQLCSHSTFTFNLYSFRAPCCFGNIFQPVTAFDLQSYFECYLTCM